MADPIQFALMAQQNNPYWAYALQLNSQSVAHNTDSVVVAYDTILQDPAGMVTLGSGAKITVPVSGLWAFGGSVSLNITGIAPTVILTAVGSLSQRLQRVGTTTDVATVFVSGASIYPLFAGNTIQMGAYQDSAGALPTIVTTGNTPYIWACLLRTL